MAISKLPNIVLVLGMHRSGTSLVAQLIHRMGAYMGENLLEANEYNPEGYWESIDLVELHTKMLSFTGNEWYAPTNTVDTSLLLKEFGECAKNLIDEMDAKGMTWCWKDPRMVLFLDFWQQLLKDRNVYFVVVVRHPGAVAESLLKRDHMPIQFAEALYNLYYYKISETIRKAKNILQVNYEDFINGSENVNHFKNSIQKILSNEISGHQISVENLIKSSLNHSNTTSIANVSLETRVLYASLCEKSGLMLAKDILKTFTATTEFLSFCKRQYNNKLKNLRIKIFWADAIAEFTENNSAYIAIDLIKPDSSYYFSLDQHYKFIRFDPLNDYAIIKNPEIEIQTGQHEWLPLKIVETNAISTNNEEYIFENDDSRFVFELGDEIRSEKINLKISLLYVKTGLEAMPAIIKLKKKEEELMAIQKAQTKILQKQYNESITEKNELNKLLNEQKDIITHLEEDKNSLNNIVIERSLEVEHIQTENVILSQHLDDRIAENENLKNALTLAQSKTEDLRTEIEKLKAEVLEKKLRISVIESNIFYKLKTRFLALIDFPEDSLVKKVINKYSNYKRRRLILKSGYFDKDWYLSKNIDVKEHGVDPLSHFIDIGYREKRDPGPKFNIKFYLETNKDVAISQVNPLIHYIKYGKKEGRICISTSTSIPATPSLPTKTNIVSQISEKLTKHINYASDITLIEKSELFDSEYYLKNNLDVKEAGVNSAKHYYSNGWLEGRNPSARFNGQYYLSAYPDIKKTSINPLIHYIKFGQNEGRLIAPIAFDEDLCEKSAGIKTLQLLDEETVLPKIAVVCHLFYPEQLPDLFNYIKNIPGSPDFYVSVPPNKKLFVEEFLSEQGTVAKYEIIEVENRGRDMAPFLIFLSTKLQAYDLVCKIHTKKSSHNINLKGWGSYLLNQLLGNKQVVETIISNFLSNPNLGLVWPLAYPYLTAMGYDKGWGPPSGKTKNFLLANQYFPNLKFTSIDDAITFPLGSMFWFRPKAFEFLKSKNIKIQDFDEENGQIDGTLAHALERVLGLGVTYLGYDSSTVYFRQALLKPQEERNKLIESKETYLFVAHDLYRAGAEMMLLTLLKWLYNHTAIKTYVLVLKKGNDEGSLLSEFSKVSQLIILADLEPSDNSDDMFEPIFEITGQVDLIYGNTIISASVYELLKKYNAPILTHIHELGESIKRYASKGTINAMINANGPIIACSTPVETFLMNELGVPMERVSLVNEFISLEKSRNITREEQRQLLSLPNDKTIIWGCGTIYWRKGPDWFIETARLVNELGCENYIFYWLGENYWDADSAEWGKWEKWENFIVQNNLQNLVAFLGPVEFPRQYFRAGDIFFLPSREDPYPIVCLEAAEAGLPIICFADSGGIPEFVGEECGYVVPMGNCRRAAEAIAQLVQNQTEVKEKGSNAKGKVSRQHIDHIAVPQILNLCRKTIKQTPLVSVIVPVYNQAAYLKQRIESVLNQTFRDYELIIIDDGSTDSSLEIARNYEAYPFVQIVENDINSGSPFKQWEKGIRLSAGQYIWIAEGDDYCNPDFLHKLLPFFSNKSVALAYCDSHIVDASGTVTGDYEDYLASLDNQHWTKSYTISGTQEINFGLGIKNTIPNASATIIKREFITQDLLENVTKFRFSGDWYFYTWIVENSEIAFLSEKLNFHRKHNQTVSSEFNTDKRLKGSLLKEAELIQTNVISKYAIKPKFEELWQVYVQNQIIALFPGTAENDFENYYPYKAMLQKIKSSIQNNTHNKRLLFITTNDGSSHGGSEKLWQKTALKCQNEGFEVTVLIRNWYPEPDFIADFKQKNIQVVTKSEEQFKEILNIKPDLTIISLGDQDEGIEYYPFLKLHDLKYIIINQLTKEPRFWPIRHTITEKVLAGYLNANKVYFTGKDNQTVMEDRLGCSLTNAAICYNPLDVNRDISLPFPTTKKGIKIAMVANLLQVHKGQHLAIEVFSMPKWRDRGVHLNIFGTGADEEKLKELVSRYAMLNVTFHGQSKDIVAIWKSHHALLMTSFMEGLPLVLVGAMLAGRVPIVTDVGAHREVIKDNYNGFIASTPAVEEIDDALERAWTRVSEWKDIGLRARTSILSYLPELDPVDDFFIKLKSNV